MSKIDLTNIEMPKDNPDKRYIKPVPREGEDGLFSQSWFPICLSEEVEKGQIRGEAFLDGRVIICRGEDGVIRVMSAFCPHLGADLGVGSMAGNHVQCAFHKWEYDEYGQCSKVAIGDPAPKAAKLFKFPSQEKYGIVWVFNGNEPLWDIPDLEYDLDEIVFRAIRYPETFSCDPWVFAANTPDMQHLKAVHQVKFKSSDPHADVVWDEYGLRYRLEATHQQDMPLDWKMGIRGTSFYWQEGVLDDVWIGGIVGFSLPEPGKHQPFAVLALKNDASEEEMAKRFEFAVMLMERTIGEDRDILNTINYNPGVLTMGDKSLGRYMDLLRNYPRAHPSGPFIK